MSGYVTKSKREILKRRMEKLGIRKEDIIEKFILGSGRGGQKLNKTASCVYLRHIPTGIEVKVQKTRFRELNRFIARRILCEKIEMRNSSNRLAVKSKQYKIRKQKARRSRRYKQKILEEKHKQSQKKALRKPIIIDDNPGNN